jgi:hypothetical protein
VSRPELPSPGPLITNAAGCLVWWPLAAMAYLVVFPSEGGIGIAVTGAALLALRVARLTWVVATSGAGAQRAGAQRLRRAAFSRRSAARSPSAARTAWS